MKTGLKVSTSLLALPLSWMLVISGMTAYQDEALFLSGANAADAAPNGEDLDDANLMILGVTLGKHSLTEIQAKLGPTEVFQGRAESHSGEIICYRSGGKRDQTFLIFEQGEVHNAFRLLTEQAGFEGKHKCKSSPLVSHDVRTMSGLKLGLSKREVVSILGPPTEKDKDILSYNFSRQVKLTEGEILKIEKSFPSVREHPFYDVSVFIRASFVDGKLISLLISKTETL
jgi:hypothetical protein